MIYSHVRFLSLSYCICFLSFLFFFNDTATTEIYTLSYTTLFRSTGDVITAGSSTVFPLSERMAELFQQEGYTGNITVDSIGSGAGRSEEHTSELQSQSNLVCRLLLEKKKKD